MVVAALSGISQTDDPEAPEISPAERLTAERVKLLVVRLREIDAPNSVAAVIDGLYMVARSNDAQSGLGLA